MRHFANAGLHGATVIQNLFGIEPFGLCKGIRFSTCLDLEHFANRDVCAFDFRRQYRFLSRQGREQNVRIGNGREQAIITGKPRICGTKQGNELGPIQICWWKFSKVIMNGIAHIGIPIFSITGR